MEEEMVMTEKGQADAGSSEEESGVDMANDSPAKRGRGRPKGSKKLQVWVTDVNLELGSEISNGGSTQPARRRGRPKGKKNTEQQSEQESGDDNADNTPKPQRGRGRPKGSGVKKQASNEDQSPKKRGRPKGSTNKKTLNKSIASEDESGADLSNGGAGPPKKGRGRPKGSGKRKAESEEENDGSSAPPRKRGRPKGSLNKKTQLRDASGESKEDITNGISRLSRRGRGRPRKVAKSDQATDGSPPRKRARGRPKGSLNKKTGRGKVGRPRKVDSIILDVATPRRKRGRPRKDAQHTAKRGRPRKHPLPSADEVKKPKIWKPLGRPRKYPRVDPPEGVTPTPRRGRGRPRKSESRKGAHFRKHLPVTTSSSPRSPSDGFPRKRGRPAGTVKSEDGTPRKRGRPKGSGKKSKAEGETELESATGEQEEYEERVEQEVEQDGEAVPEEDAENTFMDHGRSFGHLDGNDLPESTETAINEG
ncbi:serine/arginine repetitive matrix protein 2 [Myripristis murdjan]|uniref:serine/arginine repetitive matrix protein 2 n=1 Tax=Myripristis murdjan TaxID=586833 RepID=UPI001175E007|nr:serine/arginine repetitive matrix protein 2-like [Myripristis murdjan]